MTVEARISGVRTVGVPDEEGGRAGTFVDPYVS